MSQIQADSLLNELAIPFRAMILEELSSLPLWQNGAQSESLPSELRTVSDLAQASGQDCAEIVKRLQRISEWGPYFRLDRTWEELTEVAPYQFLDLGTQSATKLAALKIEDLDFPNVFQQWLDLDVNLIVLAESEARAFSACLYLKELGLNKVYYWALKLSPDCRGAG